MQAGEFIAIKRKQLGLSQRQLAILSGVHYVQVNRYEKNLSKPTLKNLQKIAGALRVPESIFEARNAALISKEIMLHEIHTIYELEIDANKIDMIIKLARFIKEGIAIPGKKGKQPVRVSI